MRQSTSVLLTVLSSISSTYAQTAQPDGVIVPFTSDLPACASLCGPLFDVQGACTPPVTQSVDDNCFCTDARLKAFDTLGTAGVSQVCGAASCTSQSDLSAVKSWYDNFCHTSTATTTTSTSAGSTSTSTSGSSSGNSSGSSGSSSGNKSWLATHYRWVVMLVVVFFLIVAGWIGACVLRKRYIRKKEKEFEMRPPVAWGPHQLQGMTGGFNYGDGVRDAPKGGPAPVPYNKEMPAVIATPANAAKGGKRESKALRKSRQ